MASAALVLWLSGCASTQHHQDYPNRQAMVNKSWSEVRACAGPPLKEEIHGTSTRWIYYNHAPVFDRSTVGAKSSVPTPHYACWATVELEQGVVRRIDYRSDPPESDASDQCEAIFDPCS
ncbi:MAG: hypothetical protein U0172_10755 [Nitrospiraceae bacterium]